MLFNSFPFLFGFPPQRWVAVVAAIVAAFVLLKIGDKANYEFIYFRF